jgi:hypothetical protein
MKVYIIEIQTDPGFWEKVGNTAYKDYNAAEKTISEYRKSGSDLTFRISYLEIVN